MDKKAHAKFKKLCKQYGIVIDGKGGHMAVLHNGRRVGTLSHTGDSNSIRACVYDLVRQGVLPQDAKRERFN